MNPRFLKCILLSTVICSFVLAGLKAQTVTFTPTNITCHNAADGKMKIDITGGSSIYRYVCLNLNDLSKSDSFGPTALPTHTFENRLPEPYLFLVRDVNTGLIIRFQTYDNYYINPQPLNATVAGTHHISCFGSATGTITIGSATGGTGVFDYTINGGTSWQSTGNFTGLTAGFYHVWMRDQNHPDCIKILNDALAITENPQLNATVTAVSPLCFGQGGSITISNPIGGSATGTYRYRINSGTWQTVTSFPNLVPGTYHVEMQQQQIGGCIVSLGTFTITQPPQLTVNISINKGLTCFDGSDGRLQANVSGGTSPYSFDWQVLSGGIFVSIGQNGQIATGLAQGRYRVVVTDANGCGTSPADIQFIRSALPVGIRDSIPPQFFYDGASATTACEGQPNGSISLNAHGGVTPYKYSITTGGAGGYQAGNQFTGLPAGSYQPWVMDKRGCKKTGEDVIVGITANSPVSLTITADPSGTVCPGTNILFTASPVNGGTSPAYQWFRNGSPVGSNQPTYTYAPSDGDQVSAELTSDIRCTTGNPATSNTITIDHHPVTGITSHPSPVTQCEGTNATFSVTATGVNRTYQWRKNGVDIPGATNSSYTINNINSSHAGNYSVRVHSDCGTDVTSNNALLTVNPATAITTQPVPLIQCAGTNATFTVVANGTVLTYQWRKNGVNIPGANSASYTISNIVAADAGIYSVLVHGNCGADVISNNASLTVNPVTIITAQPVSLTQCQGTNATFSVTATGTNLTYQWRKDGINIPGAVTAIYTINNINPTHNGNYSVTVTGDCGPARVSDNAQLTVNPSTSISVQPQPVTQCEGTIATFTVTAQGTNLTYQWRKNAVDIPGATGSSYTINNINSTHAGNYSVRVHGDCGADVISNAVALTVNSLTVITAQPVSLTQCQGTNATFSVTATGTNLTYQWRKDGVNIPGADSASYTINDINPTHNGNYSVAVTGDCGPARISDNALLTVNPATSISDQPQPVTQCEGTNATFTVTAQGTSITYQWRKNGVDIPGATGSSYTINNINSTHAGNYSVRVHGNCGADVISNAVALTVNPATSISAHPVPLTQCAGTDATFSVTAAGTSLTYQWMRNGTDIPGATSSAYTITDINATHAGNYSVRVHGTCGADVVSNNALLTVNPVTSITVQPSPLSQCEGTNATFTVTATGTNITYQWRKDGVDVPGATNGSVTIMTIDETDEGSYSVVVTGDCGVAVVSTDADLTVNPPTAITGQPVSLTQCAGTNATFTVTAQGTNLTYQWRKNGVDIAGATSASYTINNINNSHTGNYTVRVHGDCGADRISNIAVLALHTATAIITQPSGSTECAGNMYTFTVDAEGANLAYQWRKNGVSIPGATGDSYTILNIAPGDAGTYSVVVTGTCGAVTSENAVLTVNSVPAVTGQPSSVTLCAGSDHNFTVAADGLGLTYLWRKNGVPIFPAETNPTLLLNNIDAADAGSYDVVISNSCGDATSNAAILTVAVVPSIIQQPGDLDLCEGGNVTFNVDATGTGITYQWRKDGIDIAGATSPDLNLNSINLSDAGEYDVVITGLCGSLISDKAKLTVYAATAGNIDEDDMIVCAGEIATFHVTGSGSGSLFYQWQKYIGGLWTDIWDDGKYIGTFSPSLEINNVEIPDSGLYRVLVTGDCGSVYTEPVRLDVSNLIATIGTPAPFLINAQTTKIEVGFKIENHYLIHDLGFALVAPDGTEVMLKSPIFDPCGGNYSNPVNVDAVFTNLPESLPVMDYCTPLFDITGTFGSEGNWNGLNGKDPANGAWQIRVYDNTRYFADTDGILTGATLTFTDLDSEGNTRVITYNSGTISIDIMDPVALEMRSTSYIAPMKLMTSCFNTEDAKAVVTVAGGVPPYTYEWSGPTAEASEAEADLGPGIYTVTVTDFIGCSAQASVEVTAPSAILFDDVRHTDTITCHGAVEGEIRAKASGGSSNLVYTLLPGNLPSSVADSGVFTGLTAGTYTLRATDPNGCMLDTIIRINEHPALVLTIATVPVIGDEKGSISISVTGGVAPYQYSIDNGTTLQNNGDFSDLNAGIYQVYVVDAAGCFVTEQVNLNVEILDVDVTVHNISCYGLADGSFFIALLDGTGPYTLTGSFTDTLTIDGGAFAFTGQTAGSYDVKIEDSEGRLFIDIIQIIEPSEIIAGAAITDATCNYSTTDGAIDITVSGGTGGYEFEWSNGETTEDLAELGAGAYNVTITDNSGCELLFTAVVGSDTDLPLDFLPDDNWACPNIPSLFIGVDADSVRWEPAELFTDPNSVVTYATLSDETSISLTIFDDNGCFVTDNSFVTIVPELGVDIWEKDGEGPLGEIVYLNEGETLDLKAVNGSGEFSSYLWTPNMWISETDTAEVTVSPVQNITYTVTATFLCPEKDSVQIVLRRPLKIFNAFSPNGDGVNDTWVIEHAIEYGDKINVKIFNRWGEPVFESRGYGGSAEWDGNRNGKMMPVGSYYYIINIKDGKSEPYTGTVTLLR